MSLLVLDPDIAQADSLGNTLLKQVAELGFHSIETTDSRAAAELALKGSVEIAVCCCGRLDDCPSFPASVAKVWAVDRVPTQAELMAAIRAGLVDVWQ